MFHINLFCGFFFLLRPVLQQAFPGTYNVWYVQYARQYVAQWLGFPASGVIDATSYLFSSDLFM
jgi:hypothetical protein